MAKKQQLKRIDAGVRLTSTRRDLKGRRSMKQLEGASNHATAVTVQSPPAVKAKRSPRQLNGKEPAAPLQTDSQAFAVEQRTEEQIIDEVLTRPCTALGAQTPEVANRLLVQVGNAMVWPRPGNDGDAVLKGFASLEEMAPQNVTEAMLATQMIATNDAALMFLGRATLEGQNFEAVDANVLRATRLMRLYGAQIEAMQKLKGKSGQQRVRVEHVHVYDGGQAIVGTVTAGGTGRGVGDDTENQ